MVSNVTSTNSRLLQIDLAERIAESWNKAGLEYAVMHGLEGYPQRIGRDIDVFVKPKDIQKALSLMEEVLIREGWQSLICKKTWAYWTFAIKRSNQSLIVFELDIGLRWNWGPVILYSQVQDESRLGPFRIDPWATFVKVVLLGSMSGNSRLISRKLSGYSLGNQDRLIIHAHLKHLINEKLAIELLDAVEEHNAAKVCSMVPKLKTQLLGHALFHLFSFSKTSLQWLRG